MAILGKIKTEKVEADNCFNCDELVPKSTLQSNYDGDKVCDECFANQPIYCKNCYEEVEEAGDFCSKTCIEEYKWDNYREKF